MRLLRRRTARLRLTALYGQLFLLTGSRLLRIAGLFTVRSTTTARAVPAPGASQATPSRLANDQARISQPQRELAAASQARQPPLVPRLGWLIGRLWWGDWRGVWCGC